MLILFNSSYGCPRLAVAIPAGTKIHFIAKGLFGHYGRMIGSEDYKFSFDVGTTTYKKFRLSGCTVKIDGLDIISNVTKIPKDTLFHHFTVTTTIACTILGWGGLKTKYGKNVGGIIANFEIDDGAEHSYPLDDGPSVISIKNIGSGEDAIPVGFNKERWSEINE